MLERVSIPLVVLCLLAAAPAAADHAIAPPPNVTATAGDGKVLVDWDFPWTASRAYMVQYRWTSDANESSQVTEHAHASHLSYILITGLANGTTYRFRVRAIPADNSHYASDYSAWVDATPAENLPEPVPRPETLTYRTAKAGDPADLKPEYRPPGGAPAEAAADRCAGAQPASAFRARNDCEWQRQEPRPGNQHVCQPVTLIGTDGPDYLAGNGGDDVIVGRRGKDELVGNGGNDVLRGGRGHDHLRGGADDDALYGGRGDDTLQGDWGDDELHGGGGDDTYTGGPGADRFVFSAGEQGDKIVTDFDPCLFTDTIVLSGGGLASVAAILAGGIAEPGGYFVYTLRRGLTVETDMPLRAGDFLVEQEPPED